MVDILQKFAAFSEYRNFITLNIDICARKSFCTCNTGWISEIWKNVQVNIHYTYTASTETNNTSEESPGIQL